MLIPQRLQLLLLLLLLLLPRNLLTQVSLHLFLLQATSVTLGRTRRLNNSLQMNHQTLSFTEITTQTISSTVNKASTVYQQMIQDAQESIQRTIEESTSTTYLLIAIISVGVVILIAVILLFVAGRRAVSKLQLDRLKCDELVTLMQQK